jgi:hypothetical protein
MFRSVALVLFSLILAVALESHGVSAKRGGHVVSLARNATTNEFVLSHLSTHNKTLLKVKQVGVPINGSAKWNVLHQAADDSTSCIYLILHDLSVKVVDADVLSVTAGEVMSQHDVVLPLPKHVDFENNGTFHADSYTDSDGGIVTQFIASALQVCMCVCVCVCVCGY